MKLIKLFSLLFIVFIFSKCGNPDVEITNSSYEPKIAVEAYLFCGETVQNIRLTRNFELNKYQDMKNLFLSPSANNVVATINGIPLEFDAVNKTYFNNQITVDYGTTYKLEISAVIDGKELHASSITTTPKKGFEIINKDLGTVKYRQSPLKIDFKTSPGTDLYIFSLMADSAAVKNFIFDNPYFPGMSEEDLLDNYNTYRYQYNVVSDINSNIVTDYSYNVQGYDTWFYSPYTVTVYAGDENFRYYLFTASNVMEMDGNFHEPIVIFEGDGIGVFASAIKETVTFTITK